MEDKKIARQGVFETKSWFYEQLSNIVKSLTKNTKKKNKTKKSLKLATLWKRKDIHYQNAENHWGISWTIMFQ